MLLTYGEAELFTSSYRGVFDRLLAKMRTEGLTGDQLLAQVHDLFQSLCRGHVSWLEAFLATIPTPVARWSLLARCLQDLDLATDVTAEAVTGATRCPLDLHSLRLMRDTLKHEYQRAARAAAKHPGHLWPPGGSALPSATSHSSTTRILRPSLSAIAPICRRLPGCHRRSSLSEGAAPTGIFL